MSFAGHVVTQLVTDALIITRDTVENDTPFRPVDDLSLVSFHTLHCSEESVQDIPALVYKLYESRNDVQQVEDVLTAISGAVLNQGILAEVTSHIVPFLAWIIAKCELRYSKLEITRFLISLALCSRDDHEPRVKQNVSRATGSLLKLARFNVLEPSVQNVTLCFLVIAAPPTNEADQRWVMNVLGEDCKGGHSRFYRLVNHALEVTRRSSILQIGNEFEELEMEVFDCAEDWEAQSVDRERLLALCGRSHSKPIPFPVDIFRRLKLYLMLPVAV